MDATNATGRLGSTKPHASSSHTAVPAFSRNVRLITGSWQNLWAVSTVHRRAFACVSTHLNLIFDPSVSQSVSRRAGSSAPTTIQLGSTSWKDARMGVESRTRFLYSQAKAATTLCSREPVWKYPCVFSFPRTHFQSRSTGMMAFEPCPIFYKQLRRVSFFCFFLHCVCVDK